MIPNLNHSIFIADQDLPNNMIHQVAIKSLPQEWLWCETWCDDNSKKYAKTIDLVSVLIENYYGRKCLMSLSSPFKFLCKKLLNKKIGNSTERQDGCAHMFSL